ncbi:hypothetical protein [uncultured Roseibium sp.]|uniref:hypothetical protein n=1 Tax=uncultured Roseibium sp. TaxID=1936171 RepID=UPI003216F1A0
MTANFVVDSLFVGVPLLGLIGLIIGFALCFRYPDKKLFWFLISPLSCIPLSIYAANFRNQVPDANPLLTSFLALQIAFLAFLVYWIKAARAPAIFLAVASIIYAWINAFFAEMTLTGIWL